MWIATLRLANLRRIEAASLDLDPGLNALIGPNGAGKTTVLEGAFALSYGRSFRRGAHALVRQGMTSFTVFARLHHDDGVEHRLGLARDTAGWNARLNEASVARLSDLFAVCAVCCFEPGSHELIGGAADLRRRFLDWGVFHVEPGFLETWRRYDRALRQRNALLRQRAPDEAFEPWDMELGQMGQRLTEWRRYYIQAFEREFIRTAARFLPELGSARIRFDSGHDEQGRSLEQQLASRLSRDRLRLATSAGPHRADWRPVFELAPEREHLSRGQEKLAALAAVLAQAALYQQTRGEWPVLALDDLASELDAAHQAEVLAAVLETGAQILLTGTHLPAPLADAAVPFRLFHVEQGQISRAGDAPRRQPG